jgi:two-component system chemotaxis sensor kinase CheA
MSGEDDILQDFLVEAGELLEKLNGQLIELEQRPHDLDLLNAIFRGFHTIKGGAGFLNLIPLVEVCHRAEDVFNILRQGQRVADAALMDCVLRVLDVVNDRFERLRAGEELPHADPELLNQLEHYAQPAATTPRPTPAATQPSPAASEAPEHAKKSRKANTTDTHPDDEITDDEFDALLDQLHGSSAPGVTSASTAPAPTSDDITEAEFEALLDQLHGGNAPGVATPESRPSNPTPESRSPTPSPKPAESETTVRVDTARLDAIMNLVGELVLARNRLATLKTHLADEALAQAVAQLDVVTTDLQSAVMKTRMQPIKKVFGRFPRLIRDLARTLGKEMRLELIGEDTEVDKNLVEALADPLVHLVRNAADHGVERPEVRAAAGKPREGHVKLSAAQEGDHIALCIEDDGAGMDAEVLRAKAVEKGLMDHDAAARLNEQECYALIFAPGFSTKAEISDVSGRGVGMDVVKTRIAQLNGVIEIESAKGRGTQLTIRLPLTLAIMPTLMVKLDGRTYALPLAVVNDIFPLDDQPRNRVDGQEVVLVRNKPLPIFHLGAWLGEHACDGGQVVTVHAGNRRIGFVVDQVLGQEEVVIKPLGALLAGLAGFAGATITGDGRIALILDIPGLMQRYARAA